EMQYIEISNDKILSQDIEYEQDKIFFFQAEDGIRYRNVTGVQTCALPIWGCHLRAAPDHLVGDRVRGEGAGLGGEGTLLPLPSRRLPVVCTSPRLVPLTLGLLGALAVAPQFVNLGL